MAIETHTHTKQFHALLPYISARQKHSTKENSWPRNLPKNHNKQIAREHPTHTKKRRPIEPAWCGHSLCKYLLFTCPFCARCVWFSVSSFHRCFFFFFVSETIFLVLLLFIWPRGGGGVFAMWIMQIMCDYRVLDLCGVFERKSKSSPISIAFWCWQNFCIFLFQNDLLSTRSKIRKRSYLLENGLPQKRTRFLNSDDRKGIPRLITTITTREMTVIQ